MCGEGVPLTYLNDGQGGGGATEVHILIKANNQFLHSYLTYYLYEKRAKGLSNSSYVWRGGPTHIL